jgi:serine/threonine protein kinase
MLLKVVSETDKDFKEELDKLMYIRHAFVQSFCDQFRQGDKKICLLIEPADENRTMSNFIERKKLEGEKLTFRDLKKFSTQILNGLDYIHINKVIHRSLRPKYDQK